MGIRIIVFLFLNKNIFCGYSLEAPQRGTSNEYQNICFCGEIRIISILWTEKSALTRVRCPNTKMAKMVGHYPFLLLSLLN